MRHFTAAITFIFIFSSCKESSNNNLHVYSIAEEGLQQSTSSISRSTDLIFLELKEKTVEYSTKEMAMIWQPIAMGIKGLSGEMVNYIVSLKKEFKDEAGGEYPANEDWQSSSAVTEQVLNSHGKGPELLRKLVQYKNDILSVDPKIRTAFENRINVFANGFSYQQEDSARFIKSFFGKIPIAAVNVILSKLENNIRLNENELAKFCFSQIGYLDGNVESYEFLVGQSSNCLREGEILEVTAGMGAFTTNSNPKLRFNNKLIPIDENGIAIYKLKVPAKPGKYTIKIKGEFTGVNGKSIPIYKTISYTVVE